LSFKFEIDHLAKYPGTGTLKIVVHLEYNFFFYQMVNKENVT